jgi:hypothetical protein
MADDAVDGIDFLLNQHRQIEAGLQAVVAAHGDDRMFAFAELRRLIVVHEAAEQLVLHPRTKHLRGGHDLAHEVMDEEKGGKELLANLEHLNPASTAFGAEFDRLAVAMRAHAQHEERDEFPLIVGRLDADERRTMGRALRAAELSAPTHAHPTVNSTFGAVVFGPFDAIADRVRDAIHDATAPR